MVHNAIIKSWIGQTYHTNKRKGIVPKFEIGDLVYLSTKNLSMPKGQARKLIPKYIGLMKVIKWHTASDTYTLDLPDQLKTHRMHPMFHIELLQAHEPNDNTILLRRNTQAFYDVSNDNEVEWVVDELLAHRWKGNQIKFLVRWNLGDTTSEPYAHCKELEALGRYLKLHRAALVKPTALAAEHYVQQTWAAWAARREPPNWQWKDIARRTWVSGSNQQKELSIKQ